MTVLLSGAAGLAAGPGSFETVGSLAVDVRVVPAELPVTELDEWFRHSPELHSVVVELAGGPSLLTRASFQSQMAGRLGYGRAVHLRRQVASMAPLGTLVLGADTALAQAAQQILARPPQTRYEDVVVRRPGSYGLLAVTPVFELLALHFAHRSLHDPLTGLPNRLLLAEHLRALAAPPAGSAVSPVLLYVDLDGFKLVNDEHGHEVGDGVLVQVAQRLREVVRPGDVVARLGGDEFALLLREPLRVEHARAVADRVVLAAAAPFVVDDRVVTIGASVGLVAAGEVSAEQRRDSVEVLLQAADAAMYRAKSRGRGRVEPYAALDAVPVPLTRRPGLDVERRLRRALEDDALHLAYQPKYALHTGRLLELEALARWPADDPPPLGPASFVPVAESSGLIHALGEWALRSACAEAARWPAVDAPSVAVNVSAHQLADPAFADLVAAVLVDTGLDPTRLCLEVTETAAIADVAGTRARLQALRSLGVAVALDDFGTGHSSLTLLRSLPLDWVKVDRSFVDRVDVDPADAVLVRLVIEAAHTLGVMVCAEGVERPEQVRQLRALGCDAVQGYLLGRPGPPSALDPAPADRPSALLGGPCASGPTLLTGSGQLVMLSTPDRVLTYVSAESVELLGRSPAELVGTSLLDLLPPADRDRVLAHPEDYDHLRDRVLQHRLRHADGSDVWVESTSRLVRDRATSRPLEVLTTVVDVTARIAAQQALADREARFRAAFDHAPTGMAVTDRNGCFLEVNEALCRLLGRTEAELLGKPFSWVTHPDDVAADLAHFAESLAGARAEYDMRKRYLHADGSVVVTDLHVRVVHDSDGALSCVVAHVLPVAAPDR